jgi:hypothetical protein
MRRRVRKLGGYRFPLDSLRQQVPEIHRSQMNLALIIRIALQEHMLPLFRGHVEVAVRRLQ